MRAGEFRVGDRVELKAGCPVDFEGVGPVPGDVGRVVALADPWDGSRCLRVDFSRVASRWMIPRAYLQRPGRGFVREARDAFDL